MSPKLPRRDRAAKASVEPDWNRHTVATRRSRRGCASAVARTSRALHKAREYAPVMKKHEIVWHRVASRIEGDDSKVQAFIAAVPGGHLVSTSGPGAPGLCFVPGKARAVEKLIPRPAKKAKKGKKSKEVKPKSASRRTRASKRRA
jgi:hypothetical protein